MSDRNPTHITLHLRCRLPAEVMLGTVKWRISIQYYGKQSNHAEIVAESSDGKRGQFANGRSVVTEKALRMGISDSRWHWLLPEEQNLDSAQMKTFRALFPMDSDHPEKFEKPKKGAEAPCLKEAGGAKTVEAQPG